MRRKFHALFSFTLSVALFGAVPFHATYAESTDSDLRTAEEDLAKAEAEFHEQLKKYKDPKPEDIERLKKEIIEPKREALKKVMGTPTKSDKKDSVKGAPALNDAAGPGAGATLDGSKIEKTISFPGKKKPGSDLKKATPRPSAFKEESAQGAYGTDQIQFKPVKNPAKKTK